MVTTQSVTSHPQMPWCSVSRTVSSTALWNESGIDPSSTSSRNSHAGADRAGIDPEPDGGEERVAAPRR